MIKPFSVEFKRARTPVRAFSLTVPSDDPFDVPLDDLPSRDIHEDVSYDEAMRAADAVFGKRIEDTKAAQPELETKRILPNLLQKPLDPVGDRIRDAKEARAEKRRLTMETPTTQAELVLDLPEPVETPRPEPEIVVEEVAAQPVTDDDKVWEAAAPTAKVERVVQTYLAKGKRVAKTSRADAWKARRLRFKR